jgi:hypothetical protein
MNFLASIQPPLFRVTWLTRCWVYSSGFTSSPRLQTSSGRQAGRASVSPMMAIPFKGDRKMRVAVVGGGPSGSCAAEVLAQVGPNQMLSSSFYETSNDLAGVLKNHFQIRRRRDSRLTFSSARWTMPSPAVAPFPSA